MIRRNWRCRGHGAWMAGLLWLTAAASAERAYANDFDQFQNARVAYESSNYALAADLFQGLLAAVQLSDRRPVVIESRKYLAAAYLFLGRRADAEAQFTVLLSAAPDYVLDPLAFPEEVGKTFAAVKQRLEQERVSAEQERERAAATKQGQAELAAREEHDRLARLLQLAGTQRVEQVRSRWVAAIPFGVGQFQNGHEDLGLLLAVGEGTLLATSVVTFFLHESLRGLQPTPSSRDNAKLAEAAYRYTNQISFGLFAAIAITGIVDAEIRFQPTRSVERPRPLPDDLKRLRLSIGPGGAALTGRF